MQRNRLGAMLVPLLIVILAVGVTGQSARAATGREPVIVIPGVAGSEFTASSAFSLSVPNGRGGTYKRNYSKGEKIWVNVLQAAWPGDDDYFDALKLTIDGVTPYAPAVAVSGIYNDAYSDLFAYLKRRNYVEGVDLFRFPYDWRKDISTTNTDLDKLINTALIAVNGTSDPSQWRITRVDLVGHSMGGMVARRYLSDPVRREKVDQLITMGSPHLGSVKFLKALMYGDAFGPTFLGLGLNPLEVKDLVQNMPGAMELLPSEAYYNYYNNSSDSYLSPYDEARDVDGRNGIGGVLSYEALKTLLLNLNKNSGVINTAEQYHDNFIAEQAGGGISGVRWSALVGYSLATLGRLREYDSTCKTLFGTTKCTKVDEKIVDGDGTVPRLSASMGVAGPNDKVTTPILNGPSEVKFIPREHGALVTDNDSAGDGDALTWLGQQLAIPRPSSTALAAPPSMLLAADTSSTQQSPANRAAAQPSGGLNGVWVAALGPVALEVRDDQGRATGRQRNQRDKARQEITDSIYDRMPDSEFVYIQHDVPYSMGFAATAEGSTDFKVQVLGSGQVERTAIYLGVYLGAQGQARLTLKPGTRHAHVPQGWPNLEIDVDGDGVFEASMAPSAILDARESADTNGPELSVDVVVNRAGRVKVRWSASDSDSGVYAEVATIDAGTPAAQVVRNGQVVILQPGAHQLTVIAQDRAGNASVREVSLNR